MTLTDVTPNLIVADVDRSTAFYRDVLGFSVVSTVPEAPPYAFVWLQRDSVHVFLNSVASVQQEHPEWASQPIGGTASLYMLVEAPSPDTGIDAIFASVQGRATVAMPLKDQFYGMREFGIEDPDGYLIFFAQRPQ